MNPYEVFPALVFLLVLSRYAKCDRKIVLSCGEHGDENHGTSTALDREVHLNYALLLQLEERIDREYDCSGIALTTTPAASANSTAAPVAVDDLFRSGVTDNGIYNMVVNGHTFSGYFEKKDGSTWLVIQKRTRGFLDFYLDWQSYVNGFGDLNDEFWLGLEHQHQITRDQPYLLRVDLEDAEGNTAYAEYRSFSVGNLSTNYKLRVSGYSGTAGDSLIRHNNHGFTTKDRDNDDWSGGNCALEHHGAWWYRSCHRSNLNGLVIAGGQVSDRGINWYSWKNSYYSMKSVDMKIRPP